MQPDKRTVAELENDLEDAYDDKMLASAKRGLSRWKAEQKVKGEIPSAGKSS